MPKKSIIDFSRPFGPPRPGKRPSSNGPLDNPRPSQRSRSTTPKADKVRAGKNEALPAVSRALPLISSQSSSLTLLSSPTRSPSPSGTFSNDTADAPLLPLNNTLPDQPNASNDPDLQGIVGSSSQRIVRNGEVIIKDSDEERSDSEISLEDLENLIAPRRPARASPPPIEPDQPSLPSPPTTRSTGLKGRKCKSNSAFTFTTDLPIPATNIPRYKFSLDALVKQRDQDEASRLSIENSRLVLDMLGEQETAKAMPEPPALDEDLLAKIIKTSNDEDSPSMDKLLAAMQRTEALHQEMRWSFFRPEQISNIEPAECPSVEDSFWEEIFAGMFDSSVQRSYG